MSPAEFDDDIKAEIAKWRGVIEKGGIPKRQLICERRSRRRGALTAAKRRLRIA